MSNKACDTIRAVDAYFSGQRGDVAKLREHLASCDACAARYNRYLLLHRVTGATQAKERLRRDLGLSTPGLRWAHWWWVPAATVALAVALFWISPRTEPAFVARTGDLGTAPVRLYAVAPTNASTLLVDSLPSGHGIAVSYRNPSGWRHLYVAAIDPANKVYWLAPSWTTAESEPTGLAVPQSDEWREIEAVVTHPFVAHFRVVAIFANVSVPVSQLEPLLTGPPDHGALRTELLRLWHAVDVQDLGDYVVRGSE